MFRLWSEPYASSLRSGGGSGSESGDTAVLAPKLRGNPAGLLLGLAESRGIVRRVDIHNVADAPAAHQIKSVIHTLDPPAL
jgi:hypothetical protein